jgi:enoyl-CoA hydratase/carnithine racemase
MNDVKAEQLGRVLSIQLNRPSKGNALTSGMYLTLAEHFSRAANDAGVRAILLHGAGESFCAGTDVEELFGNSSSRPDIPQARLMKSLADFNKPIVASAKGTVVGAGITLLIQCDFVYAADSAQFQTAFFNLGLNPKPMSPWPLSAEINKRKGSGRVFWGRPFDAERAVSLGLVACLVRAEDLLPAAMDTANRFAEMPASAVQAGKSYIKSPYRDQLDVAMKTEGRKFIRHMRSEIAKGAVAALLDENQSASEITYIH